MATRLGPLEITCDAPPYPVVRACQRLGVQTPEDVRWCRLSSFLHGGSSRVPIFNFNAWKVFLGAAPPGLSCTCGQELPTPECYKFTFLHGDSKYYQIG